MVRQRYRNSVLKSCSYPGADADTDHILVIMRTKLRLRKAKRVPRKKSWNVEKLKEDPGEYTRKLEEKMENEDRTTGVNER